MLTPTERTQRYNLLRALEMFAQQRPGMDPRNYGTWTDYRSESRRVTQDLHDFRTILTAVERSEITAADILAATRAYSGRLQIVEGPEGSTSYKTWVNYCTGQYFPTEYRRAACAVLACALWDYHRPDCTGESPGTQLREKFARMFPRRIARRYFD